MKDGVNGHLCKNNEEFASAIADLLERGEDPKILEAGFETAKERDLPRVGEQLKEAYESLLKR